MYQNAPLLAASPRLITRSIDRIGRSWTGDPPLCIGRGMIFGPNEVEIVRRATLKLLGGAIAVAISGCLGPPVLERQVLGYDEVTRTLDERLLLLNIARVSNNEPVHFTSTSSIAATFNWTTTLGVSGERLNWDWDGDTRQRVGSNSDPDRRAGCGG